MTERCFSTIANTLPFARHLSDHLLKKESGKITVKVSVSSVDVDALVSETSSAVR
jgi:hypothetical protein